MSAEALPPRFVERCRRIVPPERWARFLAAFAAERPAAVRVNTLRVEPEAARERLARDGIETRPVEGLDEALLVPPEARARLLRHPWIEAGRLYPQSLASQLAAPLLDPRPGETVLDLCAAPGGKTAHLCCRMAGEGRLIAVEAVRKRFFKLRANLHRQGCLPRVETVLADGRAMPRRLEGRCDRVLIDAPCSSEGRFRAGEPASWRYWSPRKIKEMQKKQRGLLRAGFRCLRPGGRLLYATCTLAPEENEAVIDALLRREQGAARTVALALPPWADTLPALPAWEGRAFAPGVRHARRLAPGTLHGGFFLCAIERGA